MFYLCLKQPTPIYNATRVQVVVDFPNISNHSWMDKAIPAANEAIWCDWWQWLWAFLIQVYVYYKSILMLYITYTHRLFVFWQKWAAYHLDLWHIIDVFLVTKKHVLIVFIFTASWYHLIYMYVCMYVQYRYL